MIVVWIFFFSLICLFDLDDNEVFCKGKFLFLGNFFKFIFFRGCNFTVFCRSLFIVKRVR